jgi:hypothetical protein
MPNLPQQRDRLQPSETLFNAFPLPLTDGISRMLRRPTINRTPTGPFQVLGHMRRGFQVSALGHESAVSYALSPATDGVFGICTLFHRSYNDLAR